MGPILSAWPNSGLTEQEVILFSSENSGSLGEQWVYDQLRSRGHTVRRNTDTAHGCGHNMTIGDLTIEYRFARQSYRVRYRRGEAVRVPRWQWLIGGGCDVVILVAEDTRPDQSSAGGLYAYILPGSLVSPRQHLQLTSHPIVYRGWLNDWLNEWSVIPYLVQKIYAKNGPTYRQWRTAAGGLKRGD